LTGSGSIESLCSAPAANLESLEFEPATPPPRDSSASFV
jgi:hypothetical protein